MARGVDYYDALGLPKDASPEEIRLAYFEAAKRLHPDANPNLSAIEEFLVVQEAYEVLCNPQKRVTYDASISQNSLSSSIAVNLKYSRSIIPCSEEPQLIYVLMELICTASTDELTIPSVHVCLVIDRSTSMKGERMEMVKANAIHLIRNLKPKDEVSVIVFSDRASVLVPPSRISDIRKIEHEINMITTDGATEMLQGLTAGVSQLRFGRNQNTVQHLILLTDGHTYGDEEACYELAGQLAQEGVTISAMGIGNEWNDQFLDKMTGLCGGNAVLATSPKDLYQFMQQKANSMEKVFAKAINLKFQCDEKVQPSYIFRIYPEISPLPISGQLSLGNLQFGRSISVLFEFTVQRITKPIDRLRFFNGKISLDIPNQGSVLQYIEFRRPVAIDPEPEVPPAPIIESMSRLTLYRLQEKARLEVSQGESIQASKHLQYLATHLLSQGDRELAHTVLVEAEHIRHSQKFSKDGEKRIKYGTRALFLLPGNERREK
jgi:Ca-activated chloride channel family protein